MKIHLKHGLLILILMICLGLAAGTADASPAADNAVDWWVISSGGGQSTANNILIQDTIGQPLIGPAELPATSFSSGFWYNQQITNQVNLPIIVR